MSDERWWTQARAIVGRQTPVYQVPDVGVRPGGSWPQQVVAVVNRRTPAYRAAFGGWSGRAAVPVLPPKVVPAGVAAAAREVAETVVALLAPQEMPAFPAVSDAFFARSRRRHTIAGHLAFGDRRVSTSRRLSPVVLAAATAAANHVSRVDRQDRGQLSEQDCIEIRRIVGGITRDAGVEGDLATQITDSVVATLHARQAAR